MRIKTELTQTLRHIPPYNTQQKRHRCSLKCIYLGFSVPRDKTQVQCTQHYSRDCVVSKYGIVPTIHQEVTRDLSNMLTSSGQHFEEVLESASPHRFCESS